MTLFVWMSALPLGWWFENQGRGAFGLAVAALLFGCSKESPEAHRASSSARPAATGPKAEASLAPPPDFGCRDLIAVKAGQGQPARTIRLRPPDPTDKTIVLDKTGVVASFSRDEFLKTARCLGLKKAVHYIEHETGASKQSPLRDAFQLSYVAAALLDAGRAEVRLRDEKESRATIVRESWSSESCAGQCRAFGRIYRLSASDPSFFFQVVDKREDQPK